VVLPAEWTFPSAKRLLYVGVHVMLFPLRKFQLCVNHSRLATEVKDAYNVTGTWVSGLFAPRYFRSSERKFPLRTFAPGSESSRELSLPGA